MDILSKSEVYQNIRMWLEYKLVCKGMGRYRRWLVLAQAPGDQRSLSETSHHRWRVQGLWERAEDSGMREEHRRPTYRHDLRGAPAWAPSRLFDFELVGDPIAIGRAMVPPIRWPGCAGDRRRTKRQVETEIHVLGRLIGV